MRNRIPRRRFRTLLALGLFALSAPLAASAVTDPAPGSSAFRDKAGFYPEYAGSELAYLEGELGRPVNVVAQFGDSRPGTLSSSVWGQVKDTGKLQTRSGPTDYVLSLPLAFTNEYITADTAEGRARIAGLLDEVSSGRWDGEFRTSARYLIEGGYGDAVLRLGWEMNGPWFPWSAVGNEDRFVQAYRHVAQVMRSESGAFRFDWAPNHVLTRAQWDATVRSYPGDDVVDFVGLDIYDKGPTGVWNSSTRTWNDAGAVWRTYFLPGLEFQRDFAMQHGKKVSYPEWGLAGGGYESPQAAGGDNPYFLQSMADWMNNLPGSGGGSLAYHAYYWSDPPHSGPHRLNSFPKAWALYKALVGGSAAVPTNPVNRDIGGGSAPTPAAAPTPTAAGGGSTGGTTPAPSTVAVSSAAGIFSDNFDGTSLDPRWTFVNSRGDVNLTLGGGSATVDIPPGPRHDLWVGMSDAPKLLQPMTNADFDVEARFLAETKRFVQYQGVVVEGSRGFARFIVVNNGYRNLLHAASIVDGKEVQYAWTPIASDAAYSIRVRRVGDTFTGYYSVDGANWTQWVSFSLPMAAERIGPYVGTSGTEGSVPGFVSVIDRFVVTGSAATTAPSGVKILPAAPTTTTTTTTVAPSPVVTVPAAGVDDFSGSALASGWTVVSPRGDVGVSVANGVARLDIPGGAPHDLWVGTAAAPRLLRAAPSGNFVAEARFASAPGRAVETIGMLVEDGAGNFTRFLVFNNGWSNHIHSASVVGGSFTWRPSTEIPVSGPFSIRIARTGSAFTGWWSTDGGTWHEFTSFTAPHAIAKIGVYAATAGSDTAAPSFVGLFDRFSLSAA